MSESILGQSMSESFINVSTAFFKLLYISYPIDNNWYLIKWPNENSDENDLLNLLYGYVRNVEVP